MKEVLIPVMIDFDPRRQIGVLRIDESLPDNITDYVFAVGAVVNEKDGDNITKSTLHSVSLMTDTDYLAFLAKEGRLQFELKVDGK